jgi:hypothetical protein
MVNPTSPRPGKRTIGSWNLIGDGVGGCPAAGLGMAIDLSFGTP